MMSWPWWCSCHESPVNPVSPTTPSPQRAGWSCTSAGTTPGAHRHQEDLSHQCSVIDRSPVETAILGGADSQGLSATHPVKLSAKPLDRQTAPTPTASPPVANGLDQGPGTRDQVGRDIVNGAAGNDVINGVHWWNFDT